MKVTEIDGYIVAVQSHGDDDIEYKKMQAVLESRPTPPEGYDCRLRAVDLQWELYELESMEGEDDDEE